MDGDFGGAAFLMQKATNVFRIKSDTDNISSSMYVPRVLFLVVLRKDDKEARMFRYTSWELSISWYMLGDSSTSLDTFDHSIVDNDEKTSSIIRDSV